jgi:hypothetical protein
MIKRDLKRHRRAAALTAAALGATLLAFVGTGSAASKDEPSNSSPPSISGSEQEGHELSANHGDWTNDPDDYDYQWQRCNSNGSSCSDISGATDNQYELGSADVGNRIRVGVNATNGDGTSGYAYSATTDVITPAATKPSNTSPPSISGTVQDNQQLTGSSSAVSGATAVAVAAGVSPRNTTAPSISGTAQDNQTLTASAGTWSGTAPIAFTYQWHRCDGNGNNCQSLSGVTSATYKATSSDVGHRLRVAVTGRNAFGSSTATSGATAAVTAAGPAGAIKLSNGTISIPITSVALPDRLTVDRVAFTPPLISSRNVQVIARVHVIDSKGYLVRDALVYAIGVPANRVSRPPEAKTDQTGWATLVYTPLRGLPLKNGARLTIFVRARKPGESSLGGVSTRRLISIGVHRS